MSTDIRLMIFGLARTTTRQDLQPLIEPCAESALTLLDIPGDNDQALAVLQLGSDQLLAARLSERIRRRRCNGRALQPWLSVMPWA